jgi:hypothetical protein
MKSFRKKGEKPEDRPPPDDPGNPSVNFHGEKRTSPSPGLGESQWVLTRAPKPRTSSMSRGT